MKRSIYITVFLLVSLCAFADTYNLSKKEQQQIAREAENWIDDMPEGLQDRLSDAVSHALHGFYNEINYYRNSGDTTGISKYKVDIKAIPGGKLGEIPMRLYSSTSKNDVPILIYFHGGGWSLGSMETTDKFCRALASEGNVKVISVEYPLAPENAYPGAVKQCIDAVEYIADQYKELGFDPTKMSMGGDGAGGNLALESFSKLPGEVSIKSLVLFYPLIKTSGPLDPTSQREFGRGYGFDSRLWEAFISAYKHNSSYLSDINLPPTLLISAGRDIIIDQVKDFSYTSNVTYVEFEGALHGFITDGHQNAAFSKSVALTDYFLTH